MSSGIAVQGLSHAVLQKIFFYGKKKRNKLFLVMGSVCKNHDSAWSQIEKSVHCKCTF